MFEKNGLCEQAVAEMQKIIFWTMSPSLENCYQSKKTEQVHGTDNVVQGANKLLGDPSIWLCKLNWLCNYNLHNSNNIF